MFTPCTSWWYGDIVQVQVACTLVSHTIWNCHVWLWVIYFAADGRGQAETCNQWHWMWSFVKLRVACCLSFPWAPSSWVPPNFPPRTMSPCTLKPKAEMPLQGNWPCPSYVAAPLPVLTLVVRCTASCMFVCELGFAGFYCVWPTNVRSIC